MNRMMKKAIVLGIVGLVLGILIGRAFLFLSTPEEIEDFSRTHGDFAMIVYDLLTGILGMASMAGTVIYDVEQWSITRATVTHFLISFGCYNALGFYCGWLSPHEAIFWIMTILFILVYAMIWATQYLSYKRRIRRMNAELKRWKERKANKMSGE